MKTPHTHCLFLPTLCPVVTLGCFAQCTFKICSSENEYFVDFFFAFTLNINIYIYTQISVGMSMAKGLFLQNKIQ